MACVPVQYFPHYVIKGKAFRKRNHKISFYFSTSLSGIFRIIRRIEGVVIKYISLHVSYPLFMVDFTE